MKQKMQGVTVLYVPHLITKKICYQALLDKDVRVFVFFANFSVKLQYMAAYLLSGCCCVMQ